MRNVTDADMAAMGFVKQPANLPSKQKLKEVLFVLEFKKANPKASERTVKRAFKREFGTNELPQT
jgi:hypothetical protein